MQWFDIIKLYILILQYAVMYVVEWRANLIAHAEQAGTAF